MSFIILSPSKEMNRQVGQDPAELTSVSQAIYDRITQLSVQEIANSFKISDELAQTVYQDYQGLLQRTAKPAYLTYQGLAFRQIDWAKINLSYAQDHLRILSAFYGVLTPLSTINPYRLDFNTRLKVHDHSLKALWRPIYQEVFQGEVVYNLASQEFSSLLDRQQVRMIDIHFYQDAELIKQAPSATAKKLRGALANHLLQEESFAESSFQAFTFEGYRLNRFNLEEGQINYIKV